MKRNIDITEISDGHLYENEDMVRMGCSGCGGCCKGMGQSIILDPMDIYRLCKYRHIRFEELLKREVELNVVDGIVLPNLAMTGEDERCGFLDSDNRCTIHQYRPGICRLFPLGRLYEDGGFRYFHQIYECKRPKNVKIKIKKWLEEPDLKAYENYITKWHYFLIDAEELLKSVSDPEFQKQISLFILNTFFLTAYPENSDFYKEFYRRLLQAKKLFIELKK